MTLIQPRKAESLAAAFIMITSCDMSGIFYFLPHGTRWRVLLYKFSAILHLAFAQACLLPQLLQVNHIMSYKIVSRIWL